MKTFLFAVQFIFAGALAWSCFCRMVRTDTGTYREVRLAIWFEFVAACLVAGMPILPALMPGFSWQVLTTPWWVWVVLLVAATLMQLVTARYWRDGVPLDFLED